MKASVWFASVTSGMCLAALAVFHPSLLPWHHSARAACGEFVYTSTRSLSVEILEYVAGGVAVGFILLCLPIYLLLSAPPAFVPVGTQAAVSTPLVPSANLGTSPNSSANSLTSKAGRSSSDFSLAVSPRASAAIRVLPSSTLSVDQQDSKQARSSHHDAPYRIPIVVPRILFSGNGVSSMRTIATVTLHTFVQLCVHSFATATDSTVMLCSGADTIDSTSGTAENVRVWQPLRYVCWCTMVPLVLLNMHRLAETSTCFYIVAVVACWSCALMVIGSEFVDAESQGLIACMCACAIISIILLVYVVVALRSFLRDTMRMASIWVLLGDLWGAAFVLILPALFIATRVGATAVEHELLIWAAAEVCAHTAAALMMFLYAANYLANQLSQLNDAQTSARKEAEASNSSQKQFLRYVLHEARVPLNTVALGLQELVADVHATPKELQSEHPTQLLDTMLFSVESISKLFNDFLSLEKINCGKLEIDLEPCCLVTDVLEPARRAFEVQAHDKQIALHLESGVGLLSVVTDAGRLLQVVSNLLSNAIKFTPPSGTVVLKAQFKDASSLTSSDTCTVCIDVTDSGPGLTEEQQAVLFKPFNQVHAISKASVGTGLGLSISKRLCELLGGQVFVFSPEGKGCTFSLTFNFNKSSTLLDHSTDSSASLTTPVDAKPIQPNLSKRTNYKRSVRAGLPVLRAADCIVIVDDSDSNRELLARLLRRKGASRVLTYGGGTEALEFAQSAGPAQCGDILWLVDHQMPKMDGPEFICALHAICPGAVAIGVTGDVLQEDRESFISSGAACVVSKPVALAALTQAIQSCGFTWPLL